MIAKITGKKSIISKHTGNAVFAVFFNSEKDGKSLRTWVDPANHNYERWKPILKKYDSGKEVILDGVILRGRDLVDADSMIKEVLPAQEQQIEMFGKEG